ncbi:MAG: STAS domain-containing protein [Actinomycetota bacterium]|nr:STAS domain-containing protein [Actinomycetota bacterium]
MTAFELLVSRSAEGAVVGVRGELDLYTAPQLQDQLAKLVEQGVRQVVADLAGMEFVDSTGLSVLVDGMRRLREDGGDLTLRSPTPNATKVLEITGLSRVFVIS